MTSFDLVLIKEGDIFDGFMFDWALVKQLISKEIFEGVQKLESFDILDAPYEVVFKVAPTVATAKKMVIEIKWLDKVLKDICAKRDHSILVRKNR